MPDIKTWLNKNDYILLEQQCQLLNESVYEFTQKAVKERLRLNKQTFAQKAYDLLYKER